MSAMTSIWASMMDTGHRAVADDTFRRGERW